MERRIAVDCLSFERAGVPFCKVLHNITFEHYSVPSLMFQFLSYGHDGLKECIGEEDIQKRKCRFCGKSVPEVTFEKDAHAIQDALGNKLLFCLEECDTCNHDLAVVENQFRIMMDFRRSIFRIPRKETTKAVKVVGKDFIILADKNGEKVEMFENETNELKNLIENYKKDTQFNNQTYYSVNNQVFVKTDFNQALRNYKIKDTNAGKIIIHDIALQTNEPLATGEYYVTLERNSTYHNKPTLFYQSSTNQDIITIGDPTPKTNTFNIKVINTEVNVRKIDSETLNTIPQGDGKLNNSIFTLYDRYDARIKDIKLNEDGTFQIKDLNFNTYYIKEKTPGTGYKLNEKKYSFTLTPENPIVNIDIANEIIKGTIKIKKEYGTTNNFKPEPNISFNIYNLKDEFIKTITTNTSGEAELTLPYGKYKLIQLTTTEGYQKVEPIEFEINEENLELSYNLQNYKIDVPNTFSTTLFEKIINFIKDIICGKN